MWSMAISANNTIIWKWAKDEWLPMVLIEQPVKWRRNSKIFAQRSLSSLLWMIENKRTFKRSIFFFLFFSFLLLLSTSHSVLMFVCNCWRWSLLVEWMSNKARKKLKINPNWQRQKKMKETNLLINNSMSSEDSIHILT